MGPFYHQRDRTVIHVMREPFPPPNVYQSPSQSTNSRNPSFRLISIPHHHYSHQLVSFNKVTKNTPSTTTNNNNNTYIHDIQHLIQLVQMVYQLLYDQFDVIYIQRQLLNLMLIQLHSLHHMQNYHHMTSFHPSWHCHHIHHIRTLQCNRHYILLHIHMMWIHYYM